MAHAKNIPTKSARTMSDETIINDVRDALRDCVIDTLRASGKKEVASAVKQSPQIIFEAFSFFHQQDEGEQIFTSVPPISTRTIRVKFRKEDPTSAQGK